MIILDDLKNFNKKEEKKIWSFFTDGVMGGLSEGNLKSDNVENIPCYRMTGNVTTENNGGFIQMRMLMNPKISINEHDGIFIHVNGNNENYSLHIRTGSTIAPWQYYSFSFFAPNKWIKLNAPFSEFKKSNFYQPSTLLNQKIKSIGLVAGFKNFKADICLTKIGLY